MKVPVVFIYFIAVLSCTKPFRLFLFIFLLLNCCSDFIQSHTGLNTLDWIRMFWTKFNCSVSDFSQNNAQFTVQLSKIETNLMIVSNFYGNLNILGKINLDNFQNLIYYQILQCSFIRQL